MWGGKLAHAPFSTPAQRSESHSRRPRRRAAASAQGRAGREWSDAEARQARRRARFPKPRAAAIRLAAVQQRQPGLLGGPVAAPYRWGRLVDRGPRWRRSAGPGNRRSVATRPPVTRQGSAETGAAPLGIAPSGSPCRACTSRGRPLRPVGIARLRRYRIPADVSPSSASWPWSTGEPPSTPVPGRVDGRGWRPAALLIPGDGTCRYRAPHTGTAALISSPLRCSAAP
jgi:hypothetical protein